jgi:chromosome segregation ATPase
MFGKDNGNKPMPPMPKTATVPLPLSLPKADEHPHELVKFAPKRHDEPLDIAVMTRATQAYDTLRHQLEQMREQFEQQREEISHQRNRIELLEHSLAESKNVANEYRTEADEAKAQTAAWKVFFTNLQAVMNQYELPHTAPAKKPENLEPFRFEDEAV